MAVKKADILPQTCTRNGCFDFKVPGSAFCKAHGGRPHKHD